MLAIAIALTLAAAPARAPHPFDVHDMLSLERIADFSASPDGRWLAFEVKKYDEANKGHTSLWLAAADGSGARQLTAGEANDTTPRWMPDGRALLFLSTRGGSSQIWRISLDGGEAEQVTRFPVDVDSFRIFPDGKKLLLAMAVFPELPQAAALEETAKKAKAADEAKTHPKAYDQLLYRHWDAWDDGRRNHLFVWAPGGSAPADLLAGMNADSPTRPFGGAEDFAISPDGKEIDFVIKEPTREQAWSTDLNIYRVPADGGAKPVALTAENKAFDGAPAFSPDGKTLAYLAMARPGFESDRRRIVLLDRASGKKRVLTEGWDRDPTVLTWGNDCRTLYTVAENVGRQALFAVDVQTGEPKLLVPGGWVESPAVFGDRIAFSRDALASPAELFSVAAAGGDERKLTHVNDARLAGMAMGEFEQFSFKGAGGDEVHGFVVKPAGMQKGKKYPVALLVHGGPQGSFGDHFHYRWNPQTYAGAGYAAVTIDFHGSTGYGQAFTDSISRNWGAAPYEDLMKGLDAAIARYPFLDGSRACALGASYGGYMVNWIAGQTDRFKCLVAHDGIFDTVSAYYQTEELWFPEWEFGGPPWTAARETYEKWNPSNFVDKWRSPILVVHGGLDYRLPDAQGFSSFTAAQRRNVPSRLLYFPEENHWVVKPQDVVRWHDEVLAWLGRWTKK